MKTLLIEDSRLARKELRNLLADFPSVDIVGEAEDGAVAITLIEETEPDLLFLDIHLPGLSGFEILEQLDHVPQVIFTTAYDAYAIKSFEYNAIDYLLKPIRQERLQKAVERALSNYQAIQQTTLSEYSRIFVKDGEQCWFVALGDIYLFESQGNYTQVFFDTHKPLILKSLNYLETVLDPNLFFRINRQQIINLKAVNRILAWFNGRLKLQLKNGTEVEVSRRQTSKIKELFSF